MAERKRVNVRKLPEKYWLMSGRDVTPELRERWIRELEKQQDYLDSLSDDGFAVLYAGEVQGAIDGAVNDG